MPDKKDPFVTMLISTRPQTIADAITKAVGESTYITAEYDIEKLLEPFSPTPAIICCGEPTNETSLLEIAQVLRAQYPDLPIYFIADPNTPLDDKSSVQLENSEYTISTTAREYDRKILLKNGFTDVFILPFDQGLMQNVLGETAKKVRQTGRVYRSVKLMDITPGAKLDFETFLFMPQNKKYIRYTSVGDELDREQTDRLSQHHIGAINISNDDLAKFYKYAASQLAGLNQNTQLSETEKNERLQSSVRNMIGDLFSASTTSTEKGKQVVEDCRQVVRNYVIQTSQNKWYERVLSVTTAGTGNYGHAVNVSTFAVLFALLTNIKEVEAIALAGLIHDLGLSRVPQAIQDKPESERTFAENEIYKKHVGYTLEIIRERKLVLPELVHKIIQQHHECFDGTGYPKQLSANRICAEAQVLAIADRFDELTTLVEGRPRLSPLDAIRQISAPDPQTGQTHFSPEILSALGTAFAEQEKAAS